MRIALEGCKLTRRRWDDNKLRSYLVEKGVIKSKSQAKRDELLAKMKDTYVKTANPVWQAWSDSYIVRLSNVWRVQFTLTFV